MSTDNLQQAIGIAKGVLGNVTADQLDLPTPCKSWDVRALVNHLVGGSYFFAAVAESGAPPSGAEAPDFAGGDFVASYDQGSAAAVAAFDAPGAQEKLVKLPFGEMPGAAFMGIATVDTFTHAWDLARATGQSTDLNPALAAELLAASRMFIQPALRGDEPMPFGAEQQAGEGATAADQLAAFLGRPVS